MTERIIGIDLGTTNSLAATIFEDGPEVIANPSGQAVTPSVLFKPIDSENWVVGQDAIPYRQQHPERTIYSVKRLMGRALAEVDASSLPYPLTEPERKVVKIQIDDEHYTPQELSAKILTTVKQRAEAVLGEPVHKAVVTVPAYFDDAQRQATRDAGKIAGLEIVRILNEPTAAAIAYGLEQKRDGYIAVYDLGGGTFDVSILKLSSRVFEVAATTGNTQLGGDDFDQRLAKHLESLLGVQSPHINLQQPHIQQALLQTAESIKIELSHAPSTSFHLQLPEWNVDLAGQIDREAFNKLIHDLVEETLKSCLEASKKAGIALDRIEDVVLVGGSSCIPYVRQQVEQFFKRKPHLAIDPYKVVAIGAGIQGHLLAGGRRDFVLLDVVPLALGIETLGGTFSKLIMSNARIPCEASELFTTHVDDQTGIDINIYQGERELVKDCRSLGHFRLRGIPPMKAGLPHVKVNFQVDANGLLTVSALEERSGQHAEIEVIPSHGLTHQEIDQIIENSLEHALDDFNERQLVEFRNVAERVFRGIEECWKTAKQVLDEDTCAAIRRQMKIVEEYAKNSDAQALKEQMDLLGDLTRPLADAAMSSAILDELKHLEEVSS